MKHKCVCFVIAQILGLALAISPIYAAGNSDKANSTGEEIKRVIAQSRAKRLRVKVRFNSGCILSGAVEDVSQTTFKLRQEDTSSAATIRYSDVASVKKESSFLKVLKAIGLGAAAIPAVLIYSVLGRRSC